MTSTSSAAIDRTADSNAQSGEPPRENLQSPQENDHTPHPDVSTEKEARVEKENVNPQSEPPGHESTADHGGRDTGKHQEEIDDFGLPIRVRSQNVRPTSDSSSDQETFHSGQEETLRPDDDAQAKGQGNQETTENPDPPDETSEEHHSTTTTHELKKTPDDSTQGSEEGQGTHSPGEKPTSHGNEPSQNDMNVSPENDKTVTSSVPTQGTRDESPATHPIAESQPVPTKVPREKGKGPKASEWSHQRLTEDKESDDEESLESEGDWREMPALGEFDEYDDFGRLLARGAKRDEDEDLGGGGARKGYTRVQLDEDAQSATSMDEDTSYLFKENAGNSAGVEGEELRDPTSQLEATKDILTESQRIAYVGVTRLTIHKMALELQDIPLTRGARKALQKGRDATKMWGQAMMARLYAHMEIDAAEQIMIEQLTEHGVEPADLVRPLMQNARIKNPLAEEVDSSQKSTASVASPGAKGDSRESLSTEITRKSGSTPPPPYEAHEHEGEDVPEVRSPSELPTSAKIDIDLRWSVLCDLFLVLIADLVYDARSRTLLERVGQAMEVPSLQITRFEKRVIDALEMQEEADNQETWDESEHMEKRRKLATKRRFMVMGLATVGGGLVIGLSAGLLAPVIGAGLAAGFTTVGISGTGAFLGGAGGTALIASGATLTGSTIGLRASHRRTGAVQTFEYRPLHNNKRVNLIVTVAGWMTGKVDDVRLPFSTVDPIMGDLYSVLWEPEMLQSMGETINLLATEVSTQYLLNFRGYY